MAQQNYKLRGLIGPLSDPTSVDSSKWRTFDSPSPPSQTLLEQDKLLNCACFNPAACLLSPRPTHQRLPGDTTPPPPATTPSPLLPLAVDRRDGTMLRQTLARSAWRTGKHPASLAARTFSATATRPAEVELTVGESYWII